jgi:hypothetical protein
MKLTVNITSVTQTLHVSRIVNLYLHNGHARENRITKRECVVYQTTDYKVIVWGDENHVRINFLPQD